MPGSFFHRYVPSQLHDPVGLVRRLIRSRDPAARFALRAAVLGLLTSPLDMLLAVHERRLYARAVAPRFPIVIVCGPPRSGTTLVAQTLIRHLPVSYVNNLTSLFPRAPITANRLFGRRLGDRATPYHSYYGRTDGYGGPNDALYLWDRWLGTDRDAIPVSISRDRQIAMSRFFGAYQQFTGRPLVLKNNRLNSCASLVAEVLDGAFFLCLQRSPEMLAQSLLRARTDIHGDAGIPYGIGAPGSADDADPVTSVCRQVLFHRQAASEQRARVGAERFWIISYEEFCANPGGLIDRVAVEILGLEGGRASALPAFAPSDRVRIAPERFHEIEQRLRQLGVEPRRP